MFKNSIIVEYDTGRYPFHKVLAALFKVQSLNQLHVSWQQRMNKADLTYEDNLLLRNKMQTLKDDSFFYKIYHRWIADVVSSHYGGHISYSAHPKMRVHLAGTGSVSSFHRDADITGREQQINCYLPFTDVFETNTLWCETDYGLKDYQPVNLQYGQAILWMVAIYHTVPLKTKLPLPGLAVIFASGKVTETGKGPLVRSFSWSGTKRYTG